MDISSLTLFKFSVRLRTKPPKRHYFDNVHPIVLESRGITPANWEWKSEQFRSYTSFNVIEYENSSEIYGDSTECRVTRTGEQVSEKRHELPQVAQRYIETFAPDTFSRVDLNWEFQKPYESADNLVMSRFFNSEMFPDYVTYVEAVPLFVFEIDGLQASYSFYATSDKKSIVADVNATLDDSSNDGEMNGWLSEHRSHESNSLNVLNSLLGADNE